MFRVARPASPLGMLVDALKSRSPCSVTEAIWPFWCFRLQCRSCGSGMDDISCAEYNEKGERRWVNTLARRVYWLRYSYCPNSWQRVQECEDFHGKVFRASNGFKR